MSEQRLKTITVAGTFDVMHKGHWLLLDEAFNVSDKVFVGITTDRFAASMKKPHEIDPYEVRLGEVKKYLQKKGLLRRATFFPLDDPYGPSTRRWRYRGNTCQRGDRGTRRGDQSDQGQEGKEAAPNLRHEDDPCGRWGAHQQHTCTSSGSRQIRPSHRLTPSRRGVYNLPSPRAMIRIHLISLSVDSLPSTGSSCFILDRNAQLNGRLSHGFAPPAPWESSSMAIQ